MLHDIAASRGRAVAETILGAHHPEVWISDRYAGQQALAELHQVCLAHVLRDVQDAIDGGDTLFAPKVRDLLRWALRVGQRRPSLKDSPLALYAARAERRLDALVALPAAHPAGTDLPRQIKAWRTKFFVFLTNCGVPPTNNISECEIRPSVVFRKVTGGFRSDLGAKAPRFMPEIAPSQEPPDDMAGPLSTPSETFSTASSPSPDRCAANPVSSHLE